MSDILLNLMCKIIMSEFEFRVDPIFLAVFITDALNDSDIDKNKVFSFLGS